MADDRPTGVMWRSGGGLRFSISHGVGRDRHLRAHCSVCGRVERFDPTPLLVQKLGGLLLTDVSTRLRCRCGARQASLEIWHGPADPPLGDDVPAIYLFR